MVLKKLNRIGEVSYEKITGSALGMWNSDDRGILKLLKGLTILCIHFPLLMIWSIVMGLLMIFSWLVYPKDEFESQFKEL